MHNVRIERLWRDVRKDVLEYYRLQFKHLEELGFLNMDNEIDRTALFLVFQPRIQKTLDAFAAAWNVHKLRTEQNRSPQVIFHLSRAEGQRLGWWTNAKDCGDDLDTASDPFYGVEGAGPLPEDYTVEEEMDEGIRVHDDARLAQACELLSGIDFYRDDSNRGMDVYQEVVAGLHAVQDEWELESE